MTVRKRRRAAWATGVSLGLHALFLAAMVLGLRVAVPPPEERALEVRLVPALQPPPPPRPEPVRPPPPPERPAVGPSPRPRPTPLPSVPVPTVPLPEAAPPASPPKVEFGPSGVLPSLSGRLGCDDPLTYHLTPEQRTVCDNRLARIAREAKPLDLNISAEAKAEFDRRTRCHDSSTRGALPKSDSHDDSTGQQIGGLGYNPSFKECRPQDR
jgi:hypothetical protein